MRTKVVLSYSHHEYVGGERVDVYEWVRVGPGQIKRGVSSFSTVPEIEPGTITRFYIDGKGMTVVKCMGDGKVRTLTKKELESEVVNTTKGPQENDNIRLG